MKKRIVIIVSILVAILAIAGLYQTFALSSNITAGNDLYTVTVGDGSVVSVPAKSSKTVYYKITNKNNGAVNYGVGYTGSNVTVKVFSDSDADAQDIIEYGENKFVKLYIENTSNSNTSTTLSTILGYENGGDLIVPNGISLVSEIHLGTLSRYITHLYNNVGKSTVINNGINYTYASDNKIMKDNNDNLHYYSGTPNNYVYFNCDTYPSTNCEKWRIVGVFDGKTKIIRGSSIGNYSWDTSSSSVNSGNGKNDWSQAALMKLLNSGYDDEEAGASLYYNAEEGNCYNGTNNSTGTCSFTTSGIKNDATRNIIADTTWSLGGGNAATYVDLVYNKERGANVFSGNMISWQGKIGIPYASDYGYAADFNSCTGELSGYNASSCTSNNWMKSIFTNTYTHLLNTYSENGYTPWTVKSTGDVSYNAYNTASAQAVVPTLYLNAQVEVAGGSGTDSNPYYLNVGNSDTSTYTIRYNANGGKNAPISQTKSKDVALTLSTSVPTRAGYTFVGWGTSASATSSTYQPGGTYTTNKSITLYAIWTHNKVIVRFNTNSGTLTTSTTYGGVNYTWSADSNGTISRKAGSGTATTDFFTINYGESTASTGLPDRSDTSTYLKITRTNYATLDDKAWICKSGCSTNNKIYNQNTVYNSNDFCDASNGDCVVELNVNWKQTKTITYNANGGSGAPASQKIIEGESITISDTIPTKTNSTFKGWATTSSSTVVVFKAGEVYNYSDFIKTTLYAVWEQTTKYKAIVRFNTNSGTLTTSTTYGGINYTWSAGSTGTISRKIGSGTATTDFFTINYGESTASTGLPDITSSSTYLKLARSGYIITSGSEWICKSGCSNNKVYASGKVYSSGDFCIASTADCIAELNANWKKVHTITYDANGGSGAPGSQEVINGNTFIVSSTKPTRTGYTFKGWGTSSGATTVSYVPGNTYTPTGDVTLYAIWQVNKINIKFNTNGGTVQTSSTSSGNTYKWSQSSDGTISRTAANGSTYSDIFFTLDYGSSTDSDGLPNYNNSSYLNITRSGYSTVSGSEWICKSGCTTSGRIFNQGTKYNASDFCNATSGDCTVVIGVNWKQLFTISFDANGGSGAPSSQTKTAGVNLTLSSTKPTRNGYTFLGWSSSSSASTASYTAGGTYNVDGNATLYAVWKPNTYSITLNNQSASSAGTTKVYYQYNTTKTVNGTLCYYYTDSALTNCLTNGYDITKPTKSGYTFGGYYTSTSGAGTNYINSSGRFINNAYTTVGDKTLYANWIPAVYSITLNNQSATSAGTTKVYYQYNTTKTVNGTLCYYYTDSALTKCLTNGYDITKPTKSGYVFNGYYTGTGGSGTIYVSSAGRFTNNAYTTVGDKTLYAYWTKNTTKPGLGYDPSGEYRVCSGTRLTLTCTDKSGSGKISAWMHDNDTTTTGTGTTTAYARDNLNTLRSGGITTSFKCTDGNGNVTTASTKYVVVSCSSSGGSGGGAISAGKCNCSIAKDCTGTGRYDVKCVNGACYWANESGGALRGCY